MTLPENNLPVDPNERLPFLDEVDQGDRIGIERNEQILSWQKVFEQALSKTPEPRLADGSRNPDYFDPNKPLENALDLKNPQLDLEGFKRLLADYELIVIGSLQASTDQAKREKLAVEKRFITEVRQSILAKLEQRVEEIKKLDEHDKMEAFYADAQNKPFDLLRKVAEKKADFEKNPPQDLLTLRRLVEQLNLVLVGANKARKGHVSDFEKQIDENITKVEEVSKHIQDVLLKKYQERAVLEKVGDPALQEKIKNLFALLDTDLKKALGDALVSKTLSELQEIVARFFITDFGNLTQALEIKSVDENNNPIVLFPTEEQKRLLEQSIRRQLNKVAAELERIHGERLKSVVEKTILKIDAVTNERIALKKTDPQRVSYTAVIRLQEELKQVTSAVPLNQTALQELLSGAKKKVDGLIYEFEVVNPKYLSDKELLTLVRDRKISPYDYSNWRLTSKNDQNLGIRSEWFDRTESFDENTPGADLKRAYLKIQYVISEYTQRLIAGKQLSEINEDEVLPSLKNALTTRLELVKGLELAEAAINKGGASVREMMWYIAKTTARKGSDVTSDDFAYENLSDMAEGSQAATLKKLERLFPDSQGYTAENRQLAVDSAILFKYLTAALAELMRFTQTGAHEFEKKKDALLIENVFKYAVHVIERYSDSEHAWGELFMFLKKIPQEWGPSEAIMSAALHNTEVIKAYYRCFGDISGFEGQIQSPGFMIPLFPNLLQLSGLRPDETIQADGKVYSYGRTHFADVREYMVKGKGKNRVEIPIKFEHKDDEFDYDLGSSTTKAAVYLRNFDTDEVVGRKKLSRVMNGNTEVKGSFEEVKTGEFKDRGVFFTPEGGATLRVLPIPADSSYTVKGHLVGEFNLVEKIDEDTNTTYLEWEVDPTKHYLVVEDLQAAKFYKYNDPKSKNKERNVTVIPGAYIHEDENGVWLYNKNGVPIAPFKNGKFWQINDPRNDIKLATELGYQVNAYTDNDGNELQTTKEYSLAGTSKKLGGEGASISLKRKLAYVPKHAAIFGNAKVVIDKYSVYIEEGNAIDIVLQYGDAEQRAQRTRDLKADAALPEGTKKKIPVRKKRIEVAYIDISRVYALDNNGNKMGWLDPRSGKVFKDSNKTKLLGKVNNENVIINSEGESIGFATYAVRLNDDRKTHIAFVFPEIFDSKGKLVPEANPALRVAGIDDDRKLKLDGFVNSFEKMEVARGAYQQMWQYILSEMKRIDAHGVFKSKGSKRAEFLEFFAGWLGKIKMQDGPHMHMYAALAKFMIFNRMQNIDIHVDGNMTKEQKRSAKLAEMRGLWFEMNKTLENMLQDTGLSGAFTSMVESVLQWMVDDTNVGRGQEGMNPALTNMFWDSSEGEEARIDYLDLLWQTESSSKPNPHKPDEVTGITPGIGRGFGFSGYRDNASAFAAINLEIANAKRKNNIPLVNSLKEWLRNYQVEELDGDITAMVKPFKKEGTEAVKAAVKEEKEG